MLATARYHYRAWANGGIAVLIAFVILIVPGWIVARFLGEGQTLIGIVLAALAIGALTARASLLAQLRRERRLAGLCGKCGYDLRASTDRCPECGSSIASRSTS